MIFSCSVRNRQNHLRINRASRASEESTRRIKRVRDYDKPIESIKRLKIERSDSQPAWQPPPEATTAVIALITTLKVRNSRGNMQLYCRHLLCSVHSNQTHVLGVSQRQINHLASNSWENAITDYSSCFHRPCLCCQNLDIRATYGSHVWISYEDNLLFSAIAVSSSWPQKRRTCFRWTPNDWRYSCDIQLLIVCWLKQRILIKDLHLIKSSILSLHTVKRRL